MPHPHIIVIGYKRNNHIQDGGDHGTLRDMDDGGSGTRIGGEPQATTNLHVQDLDDGAKEAEWREVAAPRRCQTRSVRNRA